jgi:hypothetical protein
MRIPVTPSLAQTLVMPSHPLTKAQRMSYRIGRGETGVLTFEPYKSEILPLWRFKTPSIARSSSSAIYTKFLEYADQDDFIGMDMSRKFLQMGMTRAKRYANHAGGRKYDKATGQELPKSEGHEGMQGKLEASGIFREVWERAKGREDYVELKERFMKEQKEWDKEQKKIQKVEDAVRIKGEDEEDTNTTIKMKVKAEAVDEEEMLTKSRKTKVKTKVKKEDAPPEPRNTRSQIQVKEEVLDD